MEDFFDDNPNYYYRRNTMEGKTWIMTKEGLMPYVPGREDTKIPESNNKELKSIGKTTKVLGMIPGAFFGI
jgi:hypothetical protein